MAVEYPQSIADLTREQRIALYADWSDGQLWPYLRAALTGDQIDEDIAIEIAMRWDAMRRFREGRP